MPKLPAQGALAVALAVIIGSCASAPAPTSRPTTGFVIRTELPNGRVEITVATAYARGAVATIPVAIVVTRGTATGPISARVVASGVNDIGAPAEVPVRDLVVTPLVVTANASRSATLTWDTKDAKGVVVPADAYSLLVNVRSDDGGTTRTVTATVTLELR